MKNNIRVKVCLLFVAMMFTANMLIGMLGRYQPKKAVTMRIVTDLSKKYPYLQASLSQSMAKSFSGPLLEDFEDEPSEMHLVPTDSQTLKMLDLCPLFEQPKAFIDPDLAAMLDADDIRVMSEMQIAEKMPKYHVFKDAEFEVRHTALNVPCIVSLGKFGALNRTLIQLKSLDQDKLAEKAKLSQFLCAGHSLNNSRLIRNYALDGEVKYLKSLHDINESVGFLLDLGIGEWLDIEEVKKEIKHVGALLGVNNIERDISAVSSVALFDSHLGSMDPQEFAYVQNVKKNIHEGLKRNNYVHIVIIGNEESAVKHGHYFCFVIIKSGNEVQYIVLDTLPGVYHLQEGSHERDRLMFLIDNVEKGSSLVKVANLSVMPEFLQSVGLPQKSLIKSQSKSMSDEENLSKNELADERMQEEGKFENQIKSLNEFSRRLSQFGIKQELEKESEENLGKYLDDIRKISDIYGEDNAYPVLRKLVIHQFVERRLNSLK
jgi:hypothetical protein